MMRNRLTRACLVLLCLSFAAAVGGGLYEHVVLVPIWSNAPPASFAIIQPGTGVPLQRFWIPVHVAITVCVVIALALGWKQRRVRLWLLAGLSSYAAMRVWSGVFFIPEMLEFQQMPLDAPPTPELTRRVAGWTFWSVFRGPLDVVSIVCALLAWRHATGEPPGRDRRSAG